MAWRPPAETKTRLRGAEPSGALPRVPPSAGSQSRRNAFGRGFAGGTCRTPQRGNCKYLGGFLDLFEWPASLLEVACFSAREEVHLAVVSPAAHAVRLRGALANTRRNPGPRRVACF